MSDGMILAAPPAPEFEAVRDFMEGIPWADSAEYSELAAGMKPEAVELAKALAQTNFNGQRAGRMLWPNLSDANSRKRAERGKTPEVKALYEYFKRMESSDSRPVTSDEVRDKLTGMWRGSGMKDQKAFLDLTDRVIEFHGIKPPSVKEDVGADLDRAVAKAREIIAGLGAGHLAQPGVVH